MTEEIEVQASEPGKGREALLKGWYSEACVVPKEVEELLKVKYS